MKAIVVTTINPPSKAIELFCTLEDWTVYVVGDIKTPHESYLKLNCVYIHPSEQESRYPVLSALIGWNTIQRRNLGFIQAYKDGAEIVATVDDDNIPLSNWGSLIGQNVNVTFCEHSVLFDPFVKTSISNYWHRGYPLDLVKERFQITEFNSFLNVKVQAGLWNGKPDADAISQMLYGIKNYEVEGDFPFCSSKTIFSSQNAFIHRSILPNYSVLPFCGRMDDIWGCIVMQQRTKEVVLFSEPSTFHDRNYHEVISDLKQEWIGFEQTMKLLEHGESIFPDNIKKFLDIYYDEITC